MAETISKLPIKTENKAAAPAAAAAWPSFDELRREIDRVFDDFGRGSWLHPLRAASLKLEPLFRGDFSQAAPAVDLVEKDTAFEITAELPGLSPKDVDVSMRNGSIVIKGEKKDEKEEKSKDYYVKERRYGSFERSFQVPEGVDTSAIEARYANGLLTVTLPKTIEAQKPAQKIDVKAA
jgi:HSP20 family protein